MEIVRLISFLKGSESRFGAVEGDRIADLTGTSGHASLLSVLRADALDLVQAAAKIAKPDMALADVKLLPPIPDPRAIFCIGGQLSRP